MCIPAVRVPDPTVEDVSRHQVCVVSFSGAVLIPVATDRTPGFAEMRVTAPALWGEAFNDALTVVMDAVPDDVVSHALHLSPTRPGAAVGSVSRQVRGRGPEGLLRWAVRVAGVVRED